MNAVFTDRDATKHSGAERQFSSHKHCLRWPGIQTRLLTNSRVTQQLVYSTYSLDNNEYSITYLNNLRCYNFVFISLRWTFRTSQSFNRYFHYSMIVRLHNTYTTEWKVPTGIFKNGTRTTCSSMPFPFRTPKVLWKRSGGISPL